MKYIEDLKKELNKANFSSSEIEEIIEDFTEMIDEAIDSGLNEDELEAKFGSPEKIVNELHKEGEKEDEFVEDEETNSNDELEFLPDNNYSIVISLVNEDINIKVDNVDKITVEPVRVRKLKNYLITFKDNTLILKKQNRSAFSWFGSSYSGGGTFNIVLPKSILVKDLDFSIINGDGSISGLKLEKMKFKTTNGDFDINELNVVDTHIESINGDLKLENITSEQLRLSFVSGDSQFRKIQLKDELHLNTVSGDIEVEEMSCKKAFIKTISGDIDANEFYTDEIIVRTISGDVKITNKDTNRKINTIKKSTISGDIVINQ